MTEEVAIENIYSKLDEIINIETSVGNMPDEIMKCIDYCSNSLTSIHSDEKRLHMGSIMTKTLSQFTIFRLGNLLNSNAGLLTVEISGLQFGCGSLLDLYKHIFSKLDRIKIDQETNLFYQEKKQEFKTISNHIAPQSGGCYIATMAYGDYAHPQVIELRNFRDDFLSKSIVGRYFIKFYYAYSPRLAKKLKHKQNINLVIRKGLDLFIKAIKK